MSSKKSKLVAGIVLLLALFLCCAILGYSPQRSGNQLFRVLVLDPMPGSVTVLQSQDETGFGGTIWLHFKISPDDFNRILTSKNWEIHSDFLIGVNESRNSDIKDWWNPQSLGDNAIKYYVIIKNDGHESIEYIWVNAERDEVYYQINFIY